MKRTEAAVHKAPVRLQGPLEWQQLVGWLADDGVISAAEAERTVARCSAAQSAQPPLQRLSVVGMVRESDGATLTLDALSEWLASHLGLPFVRIDPLKVDVGRVAEAMSAPYAERHKVLPVQVGPAEVVVATSEPGLTDWVPEVERQTRRTVRLVVANPLDIKRYTGEFYALARRRGGRESRGGTGQLRATGGTGAQQPRSTPTTRRGTGGGLAVAVRL